MQGAKKRRRKVGRIRNSTAGLGDPLSSSTQSMAAASLHRPGTTRFQVLFLLPPAT